MAFVDNLYYMGVGMLAIFVVIGVIVGVTYSLNAIFADRKPPESDGANDQ